MTTPTTLLRFDDELEAWQSPASPAGPAGAISTRVAGLEVSLDRAHPGRLLQVSVDAASGLHDNVVADAVGASGVDALDGAARTARRDAQDGDAGAEVTVAVELQEPLLERATDLHELAVRTTALQRAPSSSALVTPRLLLSVDIAAAMVDLPRRWFTDASLDAAFERASELVSEPATRRRCVEELTSALTRQELTGWVSHLETVLSGRPTARPLTALSSDLMEELQLRSPLTRARRALQRTVEAVTLRPTALTQLVVEPTMAGSTGLPFDIPNHDDLGTAASGTIHVSPDGSHAQIRIELPASAPDGSRWVFLPTREHPRAVAPLRDGDDGALWALVHLDGSPVTPPEIEVSWSPFEEVIRSGGAAGYVTDLNAALAEGRRALQHERSGRLAEASDGWAGCARLWIAVDLPDTAAMAFSYAEQDDLAAAGRSGRTRRAELRQQADCFGQGWSREVRGASRPRESQALWERFVPPGQVWV